MITQANIIIKLHNRRECEQMGWHYINIERDIIWDFELIREAALWIKSTFLAENYQLFAWGVAYFKYEQDLLLFKLKWC